SSVTTAACPPARDVLPARPALRVLLSCPCQRQRRFPARPPREPVLNARPLRRVRCSVLQLQQARPPRGTLPRPADVPPVRRRGSPRGTVHQHRRRGRAPQSLLPLRRDGPPLRRLHEAARVLPLRLDGPPLRRVLAAAHRSFKLIRETRVFLGEERRRGEECVPRESIKAPPGRCFNTILYVPTARPRNAIPFPSSSTRVTIDSPSS
ncbi:hypothetical protein DFH09DRAFT_1364174, partial [Mycena vulgaris]